MSLRTITLPVAAGASWDDFAWPEKAAGDDLPYEIDAAAWLADAGITLVPDTTAVAASPDLIVSAIDFGPNAPPTSAYLQISGGTAGTICQVEVTLGLTSPNALTVVVQLPIRADLAAPGLVLVTGGNGLADSTGHRLADDFGRHLLAA